MSWLQSLGVAAITAALGCVGAGFLASLCVDWYRISSREGQSGYFVVMLGLIGLVAGGVVGLVCARVAAGSAQPSFLAQLGLAAAVAAGILVVSGVIAWLGADFPPRLDGQELVVEVAIRLPPGASPPKATAETPGRDYVSITADHGERRQASGPVRVEEAVQAGDRWVLPASAPLQTRDPGKSLGIQLADSPTQYFTLPLPAQPTRADMAWSQWLGNPHFGDLRDVPAAEALAVRYRVQLVVPPSPEPGQ